MLQAVIIVVIVAAAPIGFIVLYQLPLAARNYIAANSTLPTAPANTSYYLISSILFFYILCGDNRNTTY